MTDRALMDAALSDAGIGSHDFYFKGGVLFTHGDAVPSRAKDEDVKLIVIGHDHLHVDAGLRGACAHGAGRRRRDSARRDAQ